ncbi:MAG TPA: RNA 2',3'-cyclic phosphodiesterase [Methylophilaceae bacterium]|nr:RNA 2',3'-cyclic phosphodiesterase [Methylophilaceae bacterium]
MPRLFVALDFPRVVTKRLTRSQPPPLPGIRLIPPDQMHVTLHFIGDAEIEAVDNALRTVEHQTFTVTIENMGHFKMPGGAAVIWAGVQSSPELVGLHASVGKRITDLGIKTETKPYKPHVTLARCKPAVRSLIPEFVATHDSLLIPNIPIVAFTLYSSDLSHGAPEYKVEGRYPLKA